MNPHRIEGFIGGRASRRFPCTSRFGPDPTARGVASQVPEVERIERYDVALADPPRYGGTAPANPTRRRSVIETFALASGTFGIATTFLLVCLALRSVRDAHDLRLIQGELTGLMRETKELAEELHTLQCEIKNEQQAAKDGIDETKRTVEQVTEVVEHAADQVAEVVEHVAEATGKQRRAVIRRMLAPAGTGSR